MKEIKLTPTASDYKTFAKLTAKVLNIPVRDKPNEKLLELVNLGYNVNYEGRKN